MTAEWRDPYTYPGTRVLVNKLGIGNAESLKRVEHDLTRARLQEIRIRPLDGGFDMPHLCAIHRHIFQDVYPWAGELRTVNIGRAGQRFTAASALQADGDSLAQRIEADNRLKGLGKPDFVTQLVGHFSALNKLHPFREGSGRTAQVFIALLARESGWLADFDRVVRDAWKVAAARSFEGVQGPLRHLFTGFISPLRAVAFDRLERPEAIRRFPELAPAFNALDGLMERTMHTTSDPSTLRQVQIEGRARISKDLHAGKMVQMPPQVTRALDPDRRSTPER